MTPSSGAPAVRDLSPEAQAAAAWFRQFARALRMFRLYRGDNPVVRQTEESAAAALAEIVAQHGGWTLHFSATEILLGDEPVVRVASRAPGGEHTPAITDLLPFFFYRDGLRKLTLSPGVPRGEVNTLIRALRQVGLGPNSQDDLVTLLWQANLTRVQIEAVPLEQTIYLLAHAAGGPSDAPEKKGQVYAWTPSGAEIRTDLGQMAGAQGLHRDTFDDWELPTEAVEVPAAFERLQSAAAAGRAGFIAGWEAENSTAWTVQASDLLRGLLVMDGSPDSRQALTHAAVTWVASALQRMTWEEAQRALEVLIEIDPERTLGAEELAAALAGLDAEAIADLLDEADIADQSRFAGFTVGLGAPAVGLCVAVMSRAGKARARAAAVSALCYLCADEPTLLAPWLADPHWHVVRNIVFVLGHIGGSGVAPLLGCVAHHPEPRVRRQLIQALGSLSPEERTPILVAQLETRDSQLLSAALNVLTREKGPQAARAILACIEAPDFDARDEGNQRALFNALGEVADDGAVPALEALLHKGGWFSRRTVQRVAAARTLSRIGTPNAMAALQAGVRARSEVVRSACLEALGTRSTS